MYILINALFYRSKVLDRRMARSLTLVVGLMNFTDTCPVHRSFISIIETDQGVRGRRTNYDFCQTTSILDLAAEKPRFCIFNIHTLERRLSLLCTEATYWPHFC